MHVIVADELQLLEKVNRLLAEEPYVVPPSEKEVVRSLMLLREELPTAKAEDKGAILAQYDRQYALLQQLRESAQRPQVDLGTPYFGHLRLSEGGRERDLCLGKATRIQRGVRIVDWRNAPISRIFYSYSQGEEYEEALGDLVLAGQVVARRTVTILGGDLKRIDAPEGIYIKSDANWVQQERSIPRLRGGEGVSQRVYQPGESAGRRLGADLSGIRRRVDKRLPDIAGLIDPHQFELITRPGSGFVVIRGTAGSGKTTVALHRIAFLAYDDPVINSAQTLFLVFSKGLRDYVSKVLPSLGVPKVKTMTWAEWARQQCRSHFRMLPRKQREDTPAGVIRMKLHPVMMTALERQVERVDAPATVEQAVDDWVSVTTQLDAVLEVFEEFAPTAFSTAELRRATQWCRDRWEELLAWLDGDREADAALDAEDDALLLRAFQLRVGALRFRGKRPLRYRHLAIDEVQDFSPVEIRVLLDCLNQRNSITLAGDTQQHVMEQAGFTSWSNFFGHLGLEGTAVDTLQVAYRSSAEIVQFSMKLLGDLREDGELPLTTRTGPPVELFRFTDHGACVAHLVEVLRELIREEPLASVGLLTSSPALSALYYAGLAQGEVPRLRRIRDQNFSFTPGIDITEIPQVKGLEFDYVILVEVNAQHFPDTSANRRILHVGSTRAVHQLWLTSVATPSAIVRQAIAN